MEYGYYPGCTLKTHAKDFEESAIKAFRHIGIELKEMEKWYCCGTVYSLAKDNIMYKVSSIRNLIKARQEGYDKLATLCSMCYNTLKQAQKFMEDEENRMRIGAFMDEEEEYDEIEVVHALQIVGEYIGEIRKKVKNPLTKKYAAYYGCTLLRPKQIAIDEYEKPEIMEKLISALGGTAVEWHLKNECCGSYNVVSDRDAVVERAYYIIENARRNGADVIITSCPLCFFNLHDTQKDIKRIHPDFEEMEIKYFTQIMTEAFGYDKFDIGEEIKGK